ncbi:hypothetical protein RIVM261_041170 [Rivularia sp. IAM M-261]|nr:hypothetical protein RIVM261_041170 [Rivularia sp. IAM M-261]
MNKPTVTIKEKQYLVTQISVVLKLNSGSLIYLRLSDKLDSTANKPSNEETITKEFVQQIFEEQEGTFQWLGATIKFILTGYNSFESTTFELVGLVIRKDLITWFNDNDFKNKKQDYLIYQKVKTKNAWPFFSQVLGEKFDKPNQDFIDKINFLFPENGCIWRHRDSENFKFLNKALTFANRHVPEVKGWCAFDADKPLRLILFEEKKQDQTIPKLDQTWVPKSYPFLPNQYNWNYEFKSSCTLSRELSINNGQEPALIKQLVSDGNNGESDQKGKNFQAQNPVRLLFAPGTVAVAGRNIFCHTVTYEFKLPAFGDEPPTVTMKLELDYPRESGDNEILSLRLLGNFKKWRLPKDEETEIEVAPTRFNANITNWGIIDEKTQKLKVGAKAVLYTQILSPTYSNKKYSGIYIKHEKNDEMIIDIQPCGVPLVLGSIQKYRQQLEKANITLCGQKLAISVSPHNQKLSGAEAIILDKKQIKLNHEKVISGQAQRAVNFLSKNLKLGSSIIQIKSGKTTINSAVNISTPAPQIPKPNVPSRPGVAGLDSGKVGEANKNSAGNRASNKSAASDNFSRTADAVEQPVVNTFGMDVDSPEINPMDEVYQLGELFSKMSLQDKVNTFNLNDNCYYCTAAALLNMTVDELIKKSEIMQYAGGGTIEDIKNLFKEAGVPVSYQTVNSKEQLESEIKKMQNNDKFGFAYNRQDGSGHMVVLQKDQHGKVSFLDYQKDPVVNKPLEEFITQENITTAHVFYPSTTGTPQSVAGVFGTSAKSFSPQSKSKAQQYEKQDNGHSLDRHGPEVTDKDLINRLTTGVAPDGKISPTPASTRFNNYDDWLVTRQDAMNDIATREGIDLTKPPPSGKEGPFRITKDHGRAIDDGFVGDGNISKKNITDPSTGKNKNFKVFSSSKKVDNLTRTTTSIQWNKGSEKWDVKQHFPDAQNWDQTKQTYTK